MAEFIKRSGLAFEPDLKEVLEITKEQLQESKGPNAEVPKDYKESLEQAFSIPEAQENMAVIVASAKAWKKARDEKKAMIEKMADFELKMKKYEDERNLLVQASQKLNFATGTSNNDKNVTAEVVTVNAAKGQINMSQLFIPKPGPSQQERILYQMETGKELSLDVNASATSGKSFEAPPEHPYMTYVPNGMRNHPTGKYLFAHIRNNDYSNVQIPVSEKVEMTDY